MTKHLAAALAIAWTVFGVNFAAEQTWTGKISDNLCNASHTKMATGVFPPFEDPQCTLECVKAGGKFVFVDKDEPIEDPRTEVQKSLLDAIGKSL